jgi:hypothetical protein
MSDRKALTREIAARTKPRFIEIPRECGGIRVPFTEEQLGVVRNGMTAEEYRWKLIVGSRSESDMRTELAIGVWCRRATIAYSADLLRVIPRCLGRWRKQNRRLPQGRQGYRRGPGQLSGGWASVTTNISATA